MYERTHFPIDACARCFHHTGDDYVHVLSCHASLWPQSAGDSGPTMPSTLCRFRPCSTLQCPAPWLRYRGAGPGGREGRMDDCGPAGVPRRWADRQVLNALAPAPHFLNIELLQQLACPSLREQVDPIHARCCTARTHARGPSPSIRSIHWDRTYLDIINLIKSDGLTDLIDLTDDRQVPSHTPLLTSPPHFNSQY